MFVKVIDWEENEMRLAFNPIHAYARPVIRLPKAKTIQPQRCP